MSDLGNTKTINVYPNENYLAALEEESAKAESESIVSEKHAEESKAKSESESTAAEKQDDVEANTTESSKSSEKKELSREYENALASAYDYLNYTSFSKQSLYD